MQTAAAAPSFPRKREPMLSQTARGLWVPACAGTTTRPAGSLKRGNDDAAHAPRVRGNGGQLTVTAGAPAVTVAVVVRATMVAGAVVPTSLFTWRNWAVILPGVSVTSV